MASTTQLPSFNMEPPRTDDDMQLGTSPLRQPEDIDFEDLDPSRDRSVDNSMLDDAEFPAQDVDVMQEDFENNYQDDEMLDEAQNDPSDEALHYDLDMNEHAYADHAPVEDEEILYDEDENGSTTPANGQHELDHPYLADETEPQNHEKSLEPSDAAKIDTIEDLAKGAENTVNETTHITESNNTGRNDAKGFEEEPEDVHAVDNVESLQADETEEGPTGHDSVGPSSDLHYEEDPSASNVESTALIEDINPGNNTSEAFQPPIAVDETISTTDAEQISADPNSVTVETEANTQESSTDAHDIKLVYLGEEMSLFAPSEGDSTTTFFLQDASLAHVALDQLLSSCREVLGDTLGHDDELVLDIPVLGLHICEDSKYANNLTLSQVTEVYRTLCQNEQLDQMEPLYCNLSSRVCLFTQYNYLLGAAREGKHFSEIAADYVDTPEDESEQYDLSAEEINNTGVDAPEQDGKLGKQRRDQYLQTNVFYDVVDEEIPPEAAAIVGLDNDPSNTNGPIVALEEDTTTLQSNADKKFDVAKDDLNHQENLFRDGQESTHGQSHDENIIPGQSLSDHTEQTLNEVNDSAPAAHSDADVEYADILDEVQPNPQVEEPQVSQETATADLEDHDELLAVDQHSSEALNAAESSVTDHANMDEVGKEQTISATDALVHSNGKTDVVGKPVDEQNDGLETEDESSAVDNVLAEVNVDDQNATDINDLDFIDDDTIEEFSAPITPSKHPASKRKAPEDDGDLDFLDFSTPEPKRNRST